MIPVPVAVLSQHMAFAVSSFTQEMSLWIEGLGLPGSPHDHSTSLLAHRRHVMALPGRPKGQAQRSRCDGLVSPDSSPSWASPRCWAGGRQALPGALAQFQPVALRSNYFKAATSVGDRGGSVIDFPIKAQFVVSESLPGNTSAIFTDGPAVAGRRMRRVSGSPQRLLGPQEGRGSPQPWAHWSP